MKEKPKPPSEAQMRAFFVPLGENPDGLREALALYDPSRTYRRRMPDGEIVEAPGADLIAVAVAAVAAQEAIDGAIDRGESMKALIAALARFDAALDRLGAALDRPGSNP
jgi:hypothetical protein